MVAGLYLALQVEGRHFVRADGAFVRVLLIYQPQALPARSAHRVKKWHRRHFTPHYNQVRAVGLARPVAATMCGDVDAMDRIQGMHAAFCLMRSEGPIGSIGLGSTAVKMSLVNFTKRQAVGV
jgi:hypothetical protein